MMIKRKRRKKEDYLLILEKYDKKRNYREQRKTEGKIKNKKEITCAFQDTRKGREGKSKRNGRERVKRKERLTVSSLRYETKRK